jgi:cytochrome b561/HPt (histidine-containing phosphotransfer) domain-containing protein
MQSNGRHSPLVRFIHWTIALFVVCQLTMGCLLDQLRSLQYGQLVMSLHRQLGFLVLIISLVRIVALLRERPPSLDARLPRWQLGAARCVHIGFYVALIAEPIFGLFVAWGRGDTVTALGLFELPEPWDISDELRDRAMTAHIVAAASLFGLTIVHVAAVLFNHWKRRVPILERMLASDPAGTMVNRVPVAAQLSAALGLVILIALAFGINAIVKYRDLSAARTNYHATDQAAADETRTAQVAWKEIVGIGPGAGARVNADHVRELAATALTHLQSAEEKLTGADARAEIAAVAALVRPLSEGGQAFSAAAIAGVDTHLQDLIDSQAGKTQQRLSEITEAAAVGHDLIVITLAPMVLLGLVLSILLARSMTTAISRMRALVRGVAANQTTDSITVVGRGEFAELMRDMVQMRNLVQQRMRREAQEKLAIEQTMREGLEIRVRERTAELSQKTADVNAMLNNMNLGVSTVIPGNRIHPEYSHHLRTIFQIENFADRNVVDCLFARSSLGTDAKDQVAVALGSILGEEPMMFEFNSHLLPREMEIEAEDGTRKTVQMEWSPIVGENSTVDKVLIISQDVTRLRELEKNSAQQKDELDAISRIIRISIGKFNEFFESTGQFIAANRRLIDAAGPGGPELIAELFRNMHTIKGNARMFEFTRLTNAAHEAERSYDRLRQDPTVPWVSAELHAELDAVAEAAAYYVKLSEETLGRKGRASDLLTTRGAFVGNDELAQLRSLAAALPDAYAGGLNDRLRRCINALGLIPLPRIISGSIDSLASVCSKLGKPVPEVAIDDADIAVTSPFAEALKNSLIHILRNSLDHGIETPAERVLAHKPPQGRITFACVRDGDGVELRIGDDGRGLALHALYARGLAAGDYAASAAPSRAELAESIFRSGTSTAAQVTEISGRGVGLDAVRVFLREQGATIRVALEESPDTTPGFAPFAFVIGVPAAALRYVEAAPSDQLVRDVQAETARADSYRQSQLGR